MSRRWILAAALGLAATGAHAQGLSQAFTIQPVTVEFPAGQAAAVLTLQNQSDRPATFQIRPFAWDHAAGDDRLTETEDLRVSPPLGTLAPNGRQVVRLVLRRPAQAREASYRILFDQVPPPPEPGTVGFSLRISIPVFAEPAGRTAAQVNWRVETDGQATWLVGTNLGSRRQVVRDMSLSAEDGQAVDLEAGVSPYILAGATRRWRLQPRGPTPVPGQSLRLKATADTGAVDQAVAVQRVAP